MARRKSKYTLRQDGTVMLSKTINGQRKYFYGKTDAEVEQKLAAYLESMTRAMTFSEAEALWWEQKTKDLSPSTIHGYRSISERLLEEFAETPVKDIGTQDILQYLHRMKAQDYSQKAINNYRSVISSIMDVAITEREISHNPVRDVPIVKGKPKQPRQAATDFDVRRIEDTKKDSVYARMSYTMLYTGLRRGEAAALKWGDINTRNRTALIRRAVSYDSETPVIKTPKTEAGEREIVLPDNVLDVLPPKIPKAKTDYVFFPDGLPTRGTLARGLKLYQKHSGINATAHQLRHKYASLLYTAGIPAKTAQVLLGHSTIQLTQDIYTHLEKSAADQAKEIINSVAVNRAVKDAENLGK